MYIAPWSPGDFVKCLWSKTVNFPTLPESPPTLTPRAILLLTTPPPVSAFLPPTPHSHKCSLFSPRPSLRCPHPAPQSSRLGRVRAWRAERRWRRALKEGLPRCKQDNGHSKSGWKQARGKPPEMPLRLPALPRPVPPIPLSKWRRISSASASVSGCKTTPAPRSF